MARVSRKRSGSKEKKHWQPYKGKETTENIDTKGKTQKSIKKTDDKQGRNKGEAAGGKKKKKRSRYRKGGPGGSGIWVGGKTQKVRTIKGEGRGAGREGTSKPTFCAESLNTLKKIMGRNGEREQGG